jgi:Protein of unknown function (DUF3040)
MSASYPCDPMEPGGLSRYEKKILAAIEQEIQTTDPTLARHLAYGKRLTTRTPWRAPVRHGTLLLTALIVLIIATAPLPPGSGLVLGLPTTVLLVPWSLLFPARAQR